MLLGAVVEVALDPVPFGVGRGDDPGTRGAQLLGLPAQLVQRCLKRRVEADVAQCEPVLAGELGQHPLAGLRERLGACGALDEDHAEELARAGDRRNPQLRALTALDQAGQPDARPGLARDAGLRHHGLLGGRQDEAGRPTIGIGDRALEHPTGTGPHLGDLEGQCPAQRLGERQQQVIEGLRAGETAAERTQRILRRGAFLARVADEPRADGHPDHCAHCCRGG